MHDGSGDREVTILDPRSDDPDAPRSDAEARLRQLTQWAGAILVASILLPIETHHDGTRFLWQLASDLRASSAWVLLAPSLAGASMVIAAQHVRRTGTLAAIILAALIGVALSWSRARAILAWDLLPEPSMLATGPALALAAVAGAVASARIVERRAARVLLVLASSCAVAALLVPVAGEAPWRMLARILPHVAAHSGRANLMAACLLSLVVTWPAITVVVAWTQRQRTRLSLTAGALAWGAPVVLAPILVDRVLDPWRESTLTTALHGIVVLTPALLLLTHAAVTLARTAPRELRAIALGPTAGLLVAALVTWRAAKPPHGKLDWPLGNGTPAGDRLFGALLTQWNENLRERTAMRDEAVSAARGIDADLAAALDTLMRASDDPNLEERRWYRLVEGVNEASRKARIPYYVDPTALVESVGPISQRRARVDSYRIERSEQRHLGSRDVTTLHVRALVPERPRIAAMGLSRDLQPFAIVVLDEIASYATDLAQLAARPEPRCREARGETGAVERALRGCGDTLAALSNRFDLHAALLETTLRHEIQHQLDAPDTPSSAWVARRLAWAPPDHRRRVERELHAYLAQMTTRAPAATLTLVRLVRLSALSRSGVDHDAAALALEALNGASAPLAWWDAFERLRPLEEAVLVDRARRASSLAFQDTLPP
ncbi:Hypothetical protein A7982_06962 [Minicystis rosea]|nr:Hypothetical protein A7982_06962 [Minicystis rosea]